MADRAERDLADAPVFGDESFTFSYVEQYEGLSPFHGHEILVRVGASLINMGIEAPDQAPPLATLGGLVEAQLACLEVDEVCAPVPVPEGLMAEEAAAATPAS